MALLTATKDNFEEMIAQENAVVEFWAPWCGYCKRLGPVMKALGNELSDVSVKKAGDHCHKRRKIRRLCFE